MHTVAISYGDGGANFFWHTPLKPFYRIVLPMFFALSGLLVAGSFERCKTIGLFIGLRAIRIYPALIVEVFLSALLLGPLLTEYSWSKYFSDIQFWQYLLNVTGHIHYLLPGVFLNNPIPDTVNGQLWTVPYELICYIFLIVAALAGVLNNRVVAVIAFGVLTAATSIFRVVSYRGKAPDFNESDLGGLHAFPGAALPLCFLAGVLCYIYTAIRSAGNLILLLAVRLHQSCSFPSSLLAK